MYNIHIHVYIWYIFIYIYIYIYIYTCIIYTIHTAILRYPLMAKIWQRFYGQVRALEITKHCRGVVPRREKTAAWRHGDWGPQVRKKALPSGK